MGSYNTAVITTVGQALLTSVLGAQGTMTFTKLQTSSYAYASGTDLSALTSLNNVEQEANIGTATIVDSTHIAADATISNSGISTEYNANTLGIFASDGINEVLFAVSTAVTPDVIPADQGGTPSTYKYNFTLAVSSTSDITISAVGNIDASDVAYDNSVSGLSATNVQAAIDEIVSSVKRAGKITLSSVSVELTNAAPTATVSFTTNSDGVASVASSDPTIATASLSGTVVTINGIKGGKITVTISIPETEHYTACSATITVESNILVIGNTYFFGGFYWTAAEDLGNNAVCMQSQGMTAGYWPGYTLATDYTGAKSYGSADTIYDGDIDGDNIANYDAVTQAWYTKYASVEKTGQEYGSGLFLVSNAKCGTTTSGEVGSGNYFEGIKTAALNGANFGTTPRDYAYLGTYGPSSGQCWYVNGGNGKLTSSYMQNYANLVIAPAFNLDLTKVKLIPGTSTIPDSLILLNESMPTIVTWASGTDAQISAMVSSADNGIIDLKNYWSVGEERTIHLDAMAATGVNESHAAQDTVWVLMDYGTTKELVAPKTCGKNKGDFIVGMSECLNEQGYMDSTSYTSWNGCARRTWCNNVFRSAIPSAIRSIFKLHKTITAQSYNSSTNQVSEDYFAMPASAEIWKGDSQYGQGGTAGAQTGNSNLVEFNALSRFKFYETLSNVFKGLTGASKYWTRSPYYGSANNVAVVYANNPGSTRSISSDAEGATGSRKLSMYGVI